MLSEMSEMSSAPIAMDAKIHAPRFCTHGKLIVKTTLFSIFYSCGQHASVNWRASCRTRCATRQVTMKDSSPETGKTFVV